VPEKGKRASQRPLLAPLTELREVRLPIQGEKAYIQYGFRGATVKEEDRYHLDVLATLLSSSGGGRLYARLREDLGLVYSVDCLAVHGVDPGFIAIVLNTTPDRVDQALEEVQHELQTLRTENISEKELKRVKNFLVGTHEIELQRSGTQAMHLCLGELYGTSKSLGDYGKAIMNVSEENVRAAAEKYLTVDKAVMVLLSPSVN
jgi:predicted Zn-dependent peptidase